MTKCKFRINNIIEEDSSVKQADGSFAPGKVKTMNAYPVSSGSKENDEFFAATPGGSLSLTTINPSAIEGLNDGDEIYITIEKAEAAAAE